MVLQLKYSVPLNVLKNGSSGDLCILREGIFVYLWLIQIVMWQKPT